jgi:hypothetical protein
MLVLFAGCFLFLFYVAVLVALIWWALRTYWRSNR